MSAPPTTSQTTLRSSAVMLRGIRRVTLRWILEHVHVPHTRVAPPLHTKDRLPNCPSPQPPSRHSARSPPAAQAQQASALTATELTNSLNQIFGVWKNEENGGNGGKWGEMGNHEPIKMDNVGTTSMVVPLPRHSSNSFCLFVACYATALW